MQVIGPTLLMLIFGIVKYSERCVSLYLASVREVGKWQSTSADFEKLMASDDLTTVLPPVETADDRPRGRAEDRVRSLRLPGSRRVGTFFAKPEYGLRITEVVMNMIYEKVFSKALVLHCVSGYTLQFLTLFFTAAALFLFWFQGHNHYYDYYATKHVRSDIGVTYVLFWGAIVLELYSILMLFFSDWTLGKFDKSPELMSKCLRRCEALVLPALRRLAGFKMIKWDGGDGDGYACGNVFFRRWSRRVSRYSLTRAYHLCHDEDGKFGMTPKSFCSSSVYVNVVRKFVAVCSHRIQLLPV
ncbi:hypothetical protein DM860_016457 [Cuscuta australis]|uniref:DUF4220 domain-containing protein n=1 Tax=Cuscuta australis TaxID=267555 RepID=A0A328DJ80_9ASTE|nr:hypothetical protein DM860_016457 [Cuscuta australis]